VATTRSGPIFELATSDDPLRERITRAYVQHAVLVDHLIDSLPAGIAGSIGRLQATLGQLDAEIGVPDLDALRTALDGLDDDQVQGVARAICFIAEDLVNSGNHLESTVTTHLRSVAPSGRGTGG
jgi:hypothetical protein